MDGASSPNRPNGLRRATRCSATRFLPGTTRATPCRPRKYFGQGRRRGQVDQICWQEVESLTGGEAITLTHGVRCSPVARRFVQTAAINLCYKAYIIFVFSSFLSLSLLQSRSLRLSICAFLSPVLLDNSSLMILSIYLSLDASLNFP